MSVISSTIADVQTVAGVLEGPNDIGCLCSDKEYSGGSFIDVVPARINPFAFNKPIRKNKFAMLTEADRKLANYGWTIPTHSGDNGLNSLINAKEAGENWSYDKPRGIATYNEPYRIDDFRGYDDATEHPPLFFTLEQTQVQQDTQVRMYIRNKELLNPTSPDTGIWGWGWGSGKNNTSIGIGVYVSTSKTVGALTTGLTWCLLIGTNTMLGWADIGTEDKFDVRIPAAFMTAFCHDVGKYYITPFLTSVFAADVATKDTTQQVVGTAGNFFPFYGAQLEVEVVAGSVYNPLDSVTATIQSASGSRDQNTGYVTLQQVVVRVANASSDSMSIGGDITITLGQAGNNIEVHASGSAAASGYADLTFSIPTGNNIIYDESKGHISLDLTGIVTLANGTITYTSNGIELGLVEDLVFT